MKIIRRLTVLAVAGLAVPAAGAAAQGPTACVNEESHRFDFWPGTWEVESRRLGRDGTWRETRNEWRAEAVLGGCAFVDYVEGDFGGGPMRGMGTRYYNPSTDRWHITWLSTQSPGVMQAWEGGFDESGRGAFLVEIATPDGPVRSRISWWDIEDDSAEWEHAVSRDGGATWQPTWRMTFRRTRERGGASGMDEGAGATRSGRMIPRVQVRADTSHSYALYLPPGHDAERLWPAVVLMDPRGRAHVPLERFRESAGRRGYVLLSSYDTSSDQPTSGADTRRAVELILNDAVGPLSLDPRRIHLGGFSGTARLAWGMAVQTPEHIAGVAAFGGGVLPGVDLAAALGIQEDFRGAYFGGAGRGDFNYQELRGTDAYLEDRAAFHTVREYAGPHAWPPAAVAAEALHWFDLYAARTGLMAVDSAAIRGELDEAMSAAASLEAAGRAYEAWRAYGGIATGFAGLADVTAAETHRSRLGALRGVRRTLAAMERWREWEADAAERLERGLETLSDRRLPSVATLGRRIRLERTLRQAAGEDTLAAQAAERQLALLMALAAFYRPRSYLEEGRPERAVRSLELAYSARPDWPAICPRFREIPEDSRPPDSPLVEACSG